jgi:RimJ/RimL family protein N-acetyltransferase
MQDSSERARLSVSSRAAVDGRGAARVSATLLALSQTHLSADWARLRPARSEDAREIWRIANDRDVRSNSFDPEPIPWESHARWFASRLSDSNESFLVVDLGCIAGHVRLTPFSPGVLEVHFYVHASFRGKGLGKLLLEKAKQTAFQRKGIDELVGTVLPGNEPSIRSFLSSGFSPAGESRHGSKPGLLFRSRRISHETATKTEDASDAK